LIAAITLLWFTACNYTVGECWYRDQGSETAGAGAGGVILPPSPTGGDRGFGDVPPKQPLDVTNPPPECNIVTQSPCNEKCEAEDEAAAAECSKIDNEAQRRTCQDSAYARYKSCRESCQQRANKDCDDKYQDCVDNGPTSCLKKSGGKTLCQRCWERCNAGDSPSADCRRCKF
jgi:hypothetical protein